MLPETPLPTPVASLPARRSASRGAGRQRRVTGCARTAVFAAKCLVGLITVVVALALGSGAAAAHTEFKSSSPADGEVVAGPVDEIRVSFTAASVLAGDGIEVLVPDGTVLQPEVIVSEDRRDFTAILDEPLAAGVVAVRWSVQAGDAHPIEGAFRFTSTFRPAADAGSAGGASDANRSNTAPTASGSGAGVPSEAGADTLPSGGDPTGSAASVQDFVGAVDVGASMPPIGYVGRTLAHFGSLAAIGVLAFGLLVGGRVGSPPSSHIHLLRQAAVLTLVGAVLRGVGLTSRLGGFVELTTSWSGLAVGLQLAGSVAMLAASGHLTAAVQKPQVRGMALAGTGRASGDAGRVDHRARGVDSPGRRPETSAGEAVFRLTGAAAMVAASFAFDGHTAAKGSHLLTGAIAVVHVVAAAVWLGGLICLLRLALNRRGRHAQVDLRSAVVRFSVVAAGALGAVGAAGLALTIVILDSVSEIWSTPWGRILAAKTAIVAVAAAAGAYNHFVLVPALKRTSVTPSDRRRFVHTLTIELGALMISVLLAAFLVVAAS